MRFLNPCCDQVLFAVAVPTVVDRFVQQAVAQVLTPIFEEQFHDHSYGFRPNRCAQQAVLKALELMKDGHSWIVDIDLAKFFAGIPALRGPLYLWLEVLNIMHLATPASAMLAAIIYNGLIIVALFPLALRGGMYREAAPHRLLARNLAVYGLGGVIVPFAAIKALDALMVLVGVA